jgi:colanic acid/amylovoran biosynthesis protein
MGSFIHWFKSPHGERGVWRRFNLLLSPLLLGWALLVALVYRVSGCALPFNLGQERSKLVRAYLDADMIISCPGNFFVSGSGIGLPLFLAFFCFGYGWVAGKPLYMMQQTVGPFRRRWEYWAARWVFERVRIVAVRDETSRQTLQSAGMDRNRILVFPDVAFLYRGTGDPRRLASEVVHRPNVQRPYIGVTVIDFAVQNRLFGGQEGYERALVSALSAFVHRHGGAVFLFPQVSGPSIAEDDRIPSRRVAHRLTESGIPVVTIDAAWSPNELKSAYGQMDVFVGTRLHSNIFALTAGTPVVAIAYYYKTHGVMQTLDLSEWVLDIKTLTASQLEERLEQLWRRRTDVHHHLRVTLPQIQAQAQHTCTMIRNDFAARRSQ